MSKPKSLIAYYSRKGNNYVSGKIINLPVGNTEVVARKIQGITGSGLFEIIPVKAYPEDYTEATDVAKKELQKNARPALSKIIDNIDDYEVIYLGYPNWWGTMPMAVFTFLEQYNFSGKTIIPFCTHEGSGMGRSMNDIKKLCPKSKIVEGLAIKGSNAHKADKELTEWINKQEVNS